MAFEISSDRRIPMKLKGKMKDNLPISDHTRSSEAGVSNSLPADEETVHTKRESEVGMATEPAMLYASKC